MAPPKKPSKIKKDAKKFQKGKKKNKNKNKNVKTVPVDNRAVDSEWWDVFWKKNTPDPELSSKVDNIVEVYPENVGEISNVPDDEEGCFKHFFRVSKRTFEYICSLVREDLISRPPSGLINIEGRLLSVEKQVAIALRRLASGESQVSVGASFGVGQSTVSQVTWRFIEAMEERARHHLKWPNSSQMERIKSGFEASSGLPNCCGAIDATHIVMTLPAVQTSDDWCDQENNYSMFVQGVVDFEMRFLDIVTGWPGGMPISRLLKFSGFYKLCESSGRLSGNVTMLSDGEEIREYIVGGSSYPLLPWLITPFEGDELSVSMSEFNSTLETARSASVKAFSQLKGGWRILNKVMWRPDKRKLPSIILVCCLLHNIIIDCGDSLHPDVALSSHHDSDYKGQICKQVDPAGKNTRDNLAKHLLGRKEKSVCT
ncbi:protein ANTAGONIST OF LIKE HETEROCHROMATIN PROTEIN 1 [Sesamum angolense]|uniref:Protein ANTAGONIST OF LIKE HETEROCHROMATIN PROTEIN 1 n=1 Tax=Sesamum angolense TaxID=2727404 RepID=A0AAE1X8F9_9LAMI|nr:protein ANTAGONIST OF LIKE HETEROCHROMATIN PROTEIN 1 [Sesamum angolense]